MYISSPHSTGYSPFAKLNNSPNSQKKNSAVHCYSPYPNTQNKKFRTIQKPILSSHIPSCLCIAYSRWQALILSPSKMFSRSWCKSMVCPYLPEHPWHACAFNSSVQPMTGRFTWLYSDIALAVSQILGLCFKHSQFCILYEVKEKMHNRSLIQNIKI